MTLAKVDFNALVRYDDGICVAGDSGNIFISTDGETFQKAKCESNDPIHSLVYFQGKILAGSSDGQLLVGDESGTFRKIQLAVGGNIVSLSARASECFGVTDQGEILRSSDGINWNVFDFNSYYKGYYKPCQFTCVLAEENQLAVAGKHDDGSPVLMLSSQGSVWTERSLDFTDDNGGLPSLIGIPTSICRDASEDRLLVACSKGQIMLIPSCSHCNKLLSVSNEDITGISKNGNFWLIVGDGFQRNYWEVGLK